jgi:hypothetical protein
MTRMRVFLPWLLACGGLVAFVVAGCGEGAAGNEAVCGDGVLEGNEACDDGTGAGDLVTGACTDTCTWREWNPDTGGTGSAREPAVAMNADGDFVIVWQAREGTLGGERLDVFAAVYSASGSPRIPAFRVNQQTGLDQMYPSVGMDGEGRFVVAWYTWDEAGITPTDVDNVSMRAFLPDGTPATDEVQVNTWTDGPHFRVQVGINDSGALVISWANDGQDGDLTGVFAQLGDSGGNLLATPPFGVNSVTSDSQDNPHPGISGSGDFVIAWESKGQEAT